MKIVSLLKLFFKNSAKYKFILLLVFLSQIASLFLLLFFYAVLSSNFIFLNDKIDIDGAERGYTKEVVMDKLHTLMDKHEIWTVQVVFDDGIISRGSYDNEIRSKYEKNSTELDTSISLDSELENEYAIGDKYILYGKEYTVKSFGSFFGEVYVKDIRTIDKDIPVQKITIYNNIPNKRSEFLSYHDDVEKIFDIKWKLVDGGTFKDMMKSSEIIIPLTILVFCAISFGLGYNYIIKENKKLFLLMYQSGQSKTQIKVMLLSMVLVITVLSYLATSLIYFLLQPTILKIFVHFAWSLEPSDYVNMGCLSAVTILLAMSFNKVKTMLRKKE